MLADDIMLNRIIHVIKNILLKESVNLIDYF